MKSNTTIIRAECFIVHQPDLNSEYFSWLQKPYTQSDPLIDSFTWIIAGNIMWSWRFFPTGRSATNGICNEYIDWSTIHNPHYLRSHQGTFRYYQVMIQVFKIWINYESFFIVALFFQLAMNKLWSNHLLLCKCTLSLSISFLGPTPESIRSWGDPTAPLDIITSLRAFTVNFRPPLTKDTPVADFPSKWI